MVHGNCVSDGCYAMTDEKIEEIYDYFESEKLPPHVKVEHKQYTIHEANE